MTPELSPALFSRPGAHIHIVGIGGAGMSAIARVLLGRGVTVSGSDRATNAITEALEDEGAIIREGHAADNIAGADVLLISSAIRDDNADVIAARAAGIPILKRREALPLLLHGKKQIAVAGTHGKTTTTALIVHMLREAGEDPSYIVGGVMLNTGDNAWAGKGESFVIEADEYDYMFLGLNPTIAVITNIEHDHPDMFPTMDSLLDAFRQFVARLIPGGHLIACADDPTAAMLAREYDAKGGLQGKVRTYGLSSHADIRAVTSDLSVALAGRHNLLNATAAAAAARLCGVSQEHIDHALKTFLGTGRRFEKMGEARGVTVISDYGHHPTAIRANLAAARARFPGAGIWAVWQPHTYSRTRLLADAFARAFVDCDHALVTEVYAAREVWGQGDLDGAAMAARIRAVGHPDARFSGNLETTAALLRREAQPGDVVIIFSAGDAPQIGEMFLTETGKGSPSQH